MFLIRFCSCLWDIAFEIDLLEKNGPQRNQFGLVSLFADFLAIVVVVVVEAAIEAAVVGDGIISLCYARGASL